MQSGNVMQWHCNAVAMQVTTQRVKGGGGSQWLEQPRSAWHCGCRSHHVARRQRGRAMHSMHSTPLAAAAAAAAAAELGPEAELEEWAGPCDGGVGRAMLWPGAAAAAGPLDTGWAALPGIPAAPRVPARHTGWQLGRCAGQLPGRVRWPLPAGGKQGLQLLRCQGASPHRPLGMSKQGLQLLRCQRASAHHSSQGVASSEGISHHTVLWA